MSDKIEYAKILASRLHKDVVYGGGLNMLNQVQRTAELVSKSGADEATVIAAWLHKCQEAKRISPEAAPLELDFVRKHFGDKVAQIVKEVSSEPEEKEGQTKKEQWEEKSEWAKGLSKEAQTILLAEKVCNFEVSRDKPNPKKPLPWHLEYFDTRMIMVNQIGKANPYLKELAVKTKEEGIQAIQAKLALQKALDKQNG